MDNSFVPNWDETYFLVIPKDIFNQIFIYLDYETLKKYETYLGEDFYKSATLQKYGNVSKFNDRSWKTLYTMTLFELSDHVGYYQRRPEKFWVDGGAFRINVINKDNRYFYIGICYHCAIYGLKDYFERHLKMYHQLTLEKYEEIHPFFQEAHRLYWYDALRALLRDTMSNNNYDMYEWLLTEYKLRSINEPCDITMLVDTKNIKAIEYCFEKKYVTIQGVMDHFMFCGRRDNVITMVSHFNCDVSISIDIMIRYLYRSKVHVGWYSGCDPADLFANYNVVTRLVRMIDKTSRSTMLVDNYGFLHHSIRSMSSQLVQVALDHGFGMMDSERLSTPRPIYHSYKKLYREFFRLISFKKFIKDSFPPGEYVKIFRCLYVYFLSHCFSRQLYFNLMVVLRNEKEDELLKIISEFS